MQGFTSAAYFPMYHSKALLCYCLFGRDVPDEMILDSFMKYLSEEKEQPVGDYLNKSCFREDNEELMDFLDRFNCRSVVNEQNFRKILVEIPKQELIQKPHVTISSWKPIIQALKQHESFHSIMKAFIQFLQWKPFLTMPDQSPRTYLEF